MKKREKIFIKKWRKYTKKKYNPKKIGPLLRGQINQKAFPIVSHLIPT
jgi:hypothetical protein